MTKKFSGKAKNHKFQELFKYLPEMYDLGVSKTEVVCIMLDEIKKEAEREKAIINNN